MNIKQKLLLKIIKEAHVLYNVSGTPFIEWCIMQLLNFGGISWDDFCELASKYSRFYSPCAVNVILNADKLTLPEKAVIKLAAPEFADKIGEGSVLCFSVDEPEYQKLIKILRTFLNTDAFIVVGACWRDFVEVLKRIATERLK